MLSGRHRADVPLAIARTRKPVIISRPRPDGAMMMVSRPLISVVDDDESVRESLPDLLNELGFGVQAFSSGEEFLASEHLFRTKCLILDIAMPGLSGPDVQRELMVRRHEIPIIFITAHGDASVRPQLIQRGAVAVLFKPFTEAALLAAIDSALDAS